RSIKLRAGLHQWNPDQSIVFQHLRLAKSRLFKQRVRTSVKVFKEPGKIYNSRWVAVAPLHVNFLAVAQHCFALPNLVQSTVSPPPRGIRFSYVGFPFTL